MLIEHRRARNILRYLHPEVTYRISHILFKMTPSFIAKSLRVDLEYPTKLFHIKLKNPVGIGAGIDKNGDMVRLFADLGCGFHTVGSVLLKERSGNPHPRLYRYPQRLAMVNAMGLPSRGILHVLSNIAKVATKLRDSAFIIVLNIAGETIDEFVALSKIVNNVDIVNIIEINLSCPQYTRTDLHRVDLVERLLLYVRSVCSKPLLVKISPRIDLHTLRGIVRICERFSNVGLTVSNSFPTYAKFLSSGIGGVSGLPLYRLIKKIIRCIRNVSDIPVVACGGVFTGVQVLELLKKYQVSAVQIVTALAYEGLFSIYRILKELKHLVYG